MCEKAFIKYACGCLGRCLDRTRCEWMVQVDKLVQGGMPVYDKAIIKFEKICESSYTRVLYNELHRKCGKCDRTAREAAEREVQEQKR
jgi:hypothetical protein